MEIADLAQYPLFPFDFHMKQKLSLLYPEDGASTVLRNVGNDLPDNTVSHPRRLFMETAMKISYLIGHILKYACTVFTRAHHWSLSWAG
jgi:hypothetical protein